MADIITGLKGWYKFEEGSGSTTADSSGNSNTGTLINSSIFTTTHKIGTYGMQFGGGSSNTYINLGTPSSLDLSGVNRFTLAAWVYPTEAPLGNSVISDLYNGSSDTTVQYCLGFNMDGDGSVGTGSHPGCGFYDASQAGWYNIYSPDNVTLNTWTHIVGTWDGTNLKIYVNGVLKNLSVTITGVLPSTGLSGYVLGKRHDSFNSHYTFGGVVDEARIYNRAFTQADVTALYNYTGAIVTGNPAFLLKMI